MMTNHETDLRPRDVMTNDKAYYDMTELKPHGTIRRESATKNIIYGDLKYGPCPPIGDFGSRVSSPV